jgi:hypothetical protein
MQLVVIILAVSYFLGIFWMILSKDCQNWEGIDQYDVYNGYGSFYADEDYGFSQLD